MATAPADPVADAVAQVLTEDRPVRVRPNCPITDDYLVELTERCEGIWIETDEGELLISGASADNVPAISGDLATQVGIARRDDLISQTRGRDGGYWPPGW